MAVRVSKADFEEKVLKEADKKGIVILAVEQE